MTKTDSQVFCSGCNLVVAPNAPGAFESAEGYGRVHSKICESKAARAYARRTESQRSLRATINELRAQCCALVDSARLRAEASERLPKEITVGIKTGVAYSAEEFAGVLRLTLQTLYDVCANGKSYLRPEILVFADAASRALACRVRVTEASLPDAQTLATPAPGSRVDRFKVRAAKARTGKKTTARGRKS